MSVRKVKSDPSYDGFLDIRWVRSGSLQFHLADSCCSSDFAPAEVEGLSLECGKCASH